MHDAVDLPVQARGNAIRTSRQQPRLELELGWAHPQHSRRLQLKLAADTTLAKIAKSLHPDLGHARIDVVEVHGPQVVLRVGERRLRHACLEYRRRAELRNGRE